MVELLMGAPVVNQKNLSLALALSLPLRSVCNENATLEEVKSMTVHTFFFMTNNDYREMAL
jgi:hypothetical protein